VRRVCSPGVCSSKAWDEVEVKPVGAEPLQAGLHPRMMCQAPQAYRIDVQLGRIEHLRADDDLVTAVGDERSRRFPRRAVA
jgi:hypothetical protein